MKWTLGNLGLLLFLTILAEAQESPAEKRDAPVRSPEAPLALSALSSCDT